MAREHKEGDAKAQTGRGMAEVGACAVAKFIVPKNAGKCQVCRHWTGTWTVYNGQGGKSGVNIPCKTREEAERICEKLNTGDHNGQINIPQNTYHARK